MISTASKAQLTQQLRDQFQLKDAQRLVRTVATSVAAFDSLTGGLPQGAISEVFGAESSGRTSFMHSALATLSHTDLCAVIDTADAFDVKTAYQVGARLENLLWAKCGSNVPHSLAVAELVLRSGLFSVVVFDLASTPIPETRKIQQGHWLRFRRAIENTDTVFLVIGKQSFAQSLAGLVVELQPDAPEYVTTNSAASNTPPFCALLQGFKSTATQRRPLAIKSPADFRMFLSLKDRLRAPT